MQGGSGNSVRGLRTWERGSSKSLSNRVIPDMCSESPFKVSLERTLRRARESSFGRTPGVGELPLKPARAWPETAGIHTLVADTYPTEGYRPKYVDYLARLVDTWPAREPSQVVLPLPRDHLPPAQRTKQKRTQGETP